MGAVRSAAGRQWRTLVEQQEQESAAAVASYPPRAAARLDDLTASAEPLLQQLPGVVQVEIAQEPVTIRGRRHCRPIYGSSSQRSFSGL